MTHVSESDTDPIAAELKRQLRPRLPDVWDALSRAVHEPRRVVPGLQGASRGQPADDTHPCADCGEPYFERMGGYWLAPCETVPDCPLCHGGGKTWAANDDRLWVAKRFWNVMGQGYGWEIEVLSLSTGFNAQAGGGTIGWWAAKRAARRAEKRLRERYRDLLTGALDAGEARP